MMGSTKAVKILTLAAVMILAVLTPHQTAYAAPYFQMPFPCDEIWGASTYTSQPHPAIDWNWGTGNDDEDEAVVASMAGTTNVYYQGVGGWMVEVHHNGTGWVTVYAHLQPDGLVDDDVDVDQGDIIGYVGSTGTGGGSSAHLHWEQILNGVQQSTLYANGVELGTPASYKSDNTCSGYGGASNNHNGSGGDDILWYNTGTGDSPIWYGRTNMREDIFNTSYSVSITGNGYTPIKGDFNGDGNADVFWYGPGSYNDTMWYGTGTNGNFTATSTNTNRGGDFMPLAGDFNGDNYDDILWYTAGSGTNDSIWYGVESITTKFDKRDNLAIVNGTYTPAVGDFNGDGHADILWYSANSSDSIWYGVDTKEMFDKYHSTINIGGNYVPIVGDFSGNNQDDILLYGNGSNDEIWYGSSSKTTKFVKTYDVTVSIDDAQGVVGDFDKDGYDDILWYVPGSTGDSDELWYGASPSSDFPDKRTMTIDWAHTPVH